MKPFVSIIVPVYNAEKYLDTCLNSIIRQTLTNIEIIVIDDLSPDNSRSVYQKYLNKDSRIVVIKHNKNRGISSARNTGIEAANGEYIAFVDSDDFVSPDMFEKMYKASLEFNTDIISCGYSKCDDNGTILSNHTFPMQANQYIGHEHMMEYIRNSHASLFTWFVCRNIYKKEMLLKNNLKFEEEIRFGEDTIFNLYAFYYAKGIVVIEDMMYFYRNNPNSLTLKKGKTYLEENLKLQYDKKIKFYNKFGILDDSFRDLSLYVVSHQLPMMLSNVFALNYDINIIKKIREILAFDMVKNSINNIPLINRTLPIGIQIIIILSKLKQVQLLKLYLSKIAIDKN